MENTEFLKNLGIMIVAVAFIGGFGYWIRYVIKKVNPDLRYKIMYNVFKKKYNEEEVELLMDCDKKRLTTIQLTEFLLINGFKLDHAKELCFIYKQIKSKGGETNG